MMAKCADGMCHQGMIGSRRITAAAWGEVCKAFQKRIDDWNEKTKRFEVPHPGIVYEFTFCPVCGNRIVKP